MSNSSAPVSRFSLAAYIPAALFVIFAIYLFISLKIPQSKGEFNVATFSQIPVLHGGRTKPLDTVARTSLLTLSGKQTMKAEDGSKKTASEWLLDVLFSGDRADSYKVFEIDDPDVLGLIGIQQKDERLFAYSVLAPNLKEIDTQAGLAAKRPQDKRSRFQSAVLSLRDKIFTYERLKTSFQITDSGSQVASINSFGEKVQKALDIRSQNAPFPEDLQKEMQELIGRYQQMAEMADFMPIPLITGKEENDNDWISIGETMLSRFETTSLYPALLSFAQMSDSYAANDPASFNKTVSKYYAELEVSKPNAKSQSSSEALFNNFEPFYKSMVIYIIALLLAFTFWLTQKTLFNKSAFALLILAFAVHSLGLGARIILQGRPPVTNLYSSAVFVGWGAVLLGLILEKIYKNGVGNVVAAIIGFTTLIVAHHLSLQGDTMEMMRAVLDSNFWLATHVVTVTIGYSSTFLSGLIAIVYLFRRAFDRSFDKETALTLGRMAYGIICFSAIFSFIGTVLGGIWADQSWGRFWGWDPKENGALLVVLWNILILHARATMSLRTIMMLTVFGNVVTALSWFGVNMLGVGLHSYGFMDQALSWLIIFSVSQLLIMALGFLRPKNAIENGAKTPQRF